MRLGLGPVVILWIVFWGIVFWGVIDAAVRPDGAWRSADQNKIVWVLVLVLVPVVGTLAYLVAIRPQLKRAQANDRVA